MACLVGEGQDVMDLEGIEVQEIDGALLMSLLEEDHEERLSRVIESLQAEISNPISIAGDGHHDGSIRTEEGVDFRWVDEMEILVPSSSPSEDMNWYMDNQLSEFGVAADYSLFCNGSIHLEGTLWQGEESYHTIMYGSNLF